MLQQPLTDVDIEPGHVVEWSLTRSGTQHGSHRPTSYNQFKHYTSGLEESAGAAPLRSWIALVLELPGPPDRPAFRAALRELLTRHEILRCDFERVGSDGDLTCAVIDPDTVSTSPHDIGPVDTTEALRDYLFAYFYDRIDVGSWPLIAVGTVERTRSTTVFVACDHLVSDGGSVPVIARDLAAAYRAETDGGTADLPQVGSYVAFTEQQRKEFDEVDAEDPRLASWRAFMDRNGGFFPRFPLDLGIEDGTTMHPATNRTDRLLGPDDAETLAARCKEQGVRMSAALLAATGIALRDGGGPEQYRGFLPVNERGRGDLTDSVGWYVNTMPVEFTVAADLDVDDIIAAANNAMTGMLADIEVPFVKAWYALAPELAELPAWPYAVNFFSYMDFRKAAGGDDPTVAGATMHVWSSGSNGICHWFHRNNSGVHVNTIRVDTPEARTTERTTIEHVRRTLTGLTVGAVRGTALTHP